jgi:hypothetical protein
MQESDVRVHMLIPNGRSFNTSRRAQAEERSRSPIYVVADDDCMPLGLNFIRRGLEMMAKYPEYAILSPSGLGHKDSEEVVEMTTPGGINFIRKGLLLIPDIAEYEDSAVGKQLRDKGLKCGRMTLLQMNHFGERLSVTWPAMTGVTQIV